MTIPWLEEMKRSATASPGAYVPEILPDRLLALIRIAEAAQTPCTGGWRGEDIWNQELIEAVEAAERCE